MALIVEDGKMRDKANSYVSFEEADAYIVARQLWEATNIENESIVARKEAVLMRAFDWLNSLKWKGRKHCWENVNAWPRIEVPVPAGANGEYIDPYVIPKAVIQAQCELAALIYNGNNILLPVEHGGKIKSISEATTKTIDVLSESKSRDVVYTDNAPVDAWLPSVYPLLRDFLEEVPGEIRNNFSMLEGIRG